MRTPSAPKLIRLSQILPLVALLVTLPFEARGVMPAVTVSTGHGLRLSVDATWVDLAGYRPIRVKLTPVPGLANDRLVEVVFTPRMQNQQTMEVRQQVVIPAGKAGVEFVMLVPQHGIWWGYQVDVYENGRRLERLSISGGISFNYTQSTPSRLPVILYVGDTDPDTTHIASLFAVSDQNVQWNTTPTPPGGPVQLPSLMRLPMSDLLTNWLDYSSLDVILISLDELGLIASQQPQVWNAIRDWTAAGGNLFIYGLGDKLDHLSDIEKLIPFLPPVAPVTAKSDANKVRRLGAWFTPQSEDLSDHLLDPAFAAMYTVNAVPEESEATAAPPPKPATRSEEAPPFVWRDYQLGCVAAIATSQPFPGTREDWSWLLNAIGPKHWLWCQRHGVSIYSNNNDFWNFLVPGVGLAPVTAFQVLISLFVVVIGPVNYFLLKRRGQLHLLLISTPICALFITLCLFVWSLVGDGLSVRARVRSYTQIDQLHGHAVTWARQSYYAGLAPNDGLRFPLDTFVWPVGPVATQPLGMGGQKRLLEWEDEQHLSYGWLPSRTPTQYITVRSRPSEARLQVHPAPGGAPPTVENQLGTPVKMLALRDDDGATFWGEGIDLDGKLTLQPISNSEVNARLLRMANDARPNVPDGFDVNSIRQGGWWGGIRFYGYWTQDISIPSMSTGRLEMGLTTALADPDALGPNSYVAIVSRSPEVVLGTDSVVEQDSFHVIVGRW